MEAMITSAADIGAEQVLAFVHSSVISQMSASVVTTLK